jgi:phosphatidylglycerophosphate synthase
VPLNIANLITACRIALAPVLLLLAWNRLEHLFLACLVVALVSDIVDGQLARRLHLTSELGARLDSWADLLTYASVPLATYWLRPDLVSTLKVAFTAAVASYAIPVIIGFLKFRSLTSYHTFMARVSAYLLGAAVIVLFSHGPTLPFRIAVCVLVLAELEEIAITLALPVARANVRSLRSALEIRHSVRAAG